MRLSSGIHVPDYYRRDHPIEIIDPLRMPPLPDVGKMPAVVPLQCAIAYINGNSAVSSGGLSSLGVTITGTTTGNLLVFCAVTSGGSDGTTGVADGVNTYTKRVGRTFLSGQGGGQIWSAINAGSGDLTPTISFTGAPFVSVSVHILEYSGIDQTSPFDVQNSATGTSTAPNSGTALTTQDDELIVGFTNRASTGGAFTPGTGFTARVSSTNSGEPMADSMDRIVSSVGNYAADGTLGASHGWVMCMATFKAAAAGSTGFGQPLGGRRNNPVAMMG